MLDRLQTCHDDLRVPRIRYEFTDNVLPSKIAIRPEKTQTHDRERALKSQQERMGF